MEVSSKEVVKVMSPQEIEEGISSIQTVTWDPFTVFPKETYVKIFDMLDNPVDKMNFMNAHMKWYELFNANRTFFLFQDVFEVMSKAEGEISIRCPDAHNFRLVCKVWDKAVQNYFQLHESNFNLDTFGSNGRFNIRKQVLQELEDGDGVENVKLNWHFAWIDGEDLEECLKVLPVTHPPSRNPFLSRKLCLFLPPLFEDVERYVTAVDSFMEMYGRHIWHCAITTDLDPENCRRMAKWLSRMPELKTLVIYAEKEMDIWGIWCMEPLLFLKMDKLKVLKSEGLPPVVFNKLFSNLKGLEKIQIRLEGSSLTEFEVPANPETLKEAFFTPKDIKDLFDFVEECGPFPNLKVLSIKLGLMDGRTKEDAFLKLDDWRMASSIFEEKFPALEDLSLRLPTAVPLKERLNLPKLKKLWISLPKWASLDFLLPCKALVELKVRLEHLNLPRYVRRYPTQQQSGLDERETKYVDLKTLWESNVWDEFPKLNVLDVEVCEKKGPNGYYRYERKEEPRNRQDSEDSDQSSEEFSDSGNEVSSCDSDE